MSVNMTMSDTDSGCGNFAPQELEHELEQEPEQDLDQMQPQYPDWMLRAADSLGLNWHHYAYTAHMRRARERERAASCS